MPKNANITQYTKKKKRLCNTLNWGNWNSGFVKLGVRWAERDTYNDIKKYDVDNLMNLYINLFNIV